MSPSYLQYLVLPPVGNVLLMLAGFAIWRSSRGLGLTLVIGGLVSLLVISTPLVSYWLRHGLEIYPPLTAAEARRGQAIVILGGGRNYHSPEFGWGDAPSNTTWRRLAYGVFLARQYDLPVLLSGGRVHDEPLAESQLMARAMRQVFDIRPTWLETQSRNTAENASETARVLQGTDIQRVLLVSQAWHLPRAVAAFEHAGLEAIPAPTEFAGKPHLDPLAFVPRAYYLRQSSRALHEWLGRLVYGLRRWL
ncbi:YdcF family protein [Modicisalibacter coralii]|uniref:YdcF family protein n=1 Tax=Modicisalibacter coralii TaxID=2304602 RepID=UPI00100A5830|nr:YdcF family protein [Halomonas coralii]